MVVLLDNVTKALSKSPYLVLLIVVFLVLLFRAAKKKRWAIPWRLQSHTNWAESEVSRILARLDSEYSVYNNVLIKAGDNSCQIDHLVVSRYGIFVIETKDYRGAIYGGINGDYWTQYLRSKPYSFYNPIKQNAAHVNALLHQIPHCGPSKYIPIVVFAPHGDLRLKIDGGAEVVYTYSLTKTILLHSEQLLTVEEVEEYKKNLEARLLTSKEDLDAHLQYVSNLVETKRSMEHSGVCPRCGGSLVLRQGKNGLFYGCSNYPKCRYTLSPRNM